MGAPGPQSPCQVLVLSPSLGKHQQGSPEECQRQQEGHRLHSPSQLGPKSWWWWAGLSAPGTVQPTESTSQQNSPSASACHV